ncbi:hypothetical protein J4E85_002375 [Alternaria conjuncta]|uniref:uncharacterized protein n=1 Tax=Alternaria conjuncta TaxID=181017 RepID=UPI00221FFF82|nr:uncharacterized protein J4E85_002375 [Alternaria conjuncta]KAI4934518.1 hypothetical protein J4E85_002375 [Alternaria conjuncta]
MTTQSNATRLADEARKLMEHRMDEYNTILNKFDETEPKKDDRPVPYINPPRTILLEEFICLKEWGRDIGIYGYDDQRTKHDFRNLPSVTKSSIIDYLKKMYDTLDVMRVIVGNKRQPWWEGSHELMYPDLKCKGMLDQQIGNLRCIIVNLELSIDPEDGPNTGRDDASPGIKMLFRRCATEYTTFFKRIERSLSLTYKLPSGHIEGPRNEFIRWGREAGVLREGRKFVETRIVDSGKSESRGQIVKVLLSIGSALGTMSELLPEKYVSGEDLTTADTGNNSNSNLGLTELAKGLIEQMAILRQYNESLTRETKNLVRR